MAASCSRRPSSTTRARRSFRAGPTMRFARYKLTGSTVVLPDGQRPRRRRGDPGRALRRADEDVPARPGSARPHAPLPHRGGAPGRPRAARRRLRQGHHAHGRHLDLPLDGRPSCSRDLTRDRSRYIVIDRKKGETMTSTTVPYPFPRGRRRRAHGILFMTDDRPAHRRRRSGRGWGPRGHGGQFFGGRRARRGNIRTAIVTLLAERPMHGYEIMSELAERSGGVWRPSPGSRVPDAPAARGRRPRRARRVRERAPRVPAHGHGQEGGISAHRPGTVGRCRRGGPTMRSSSFASSSCRCSRRRGR